MIKQNLQQSNDDWLKWRHRHIGGSDAPVVMGVSPWKTPIELWEEKTAPNPPEDEPNFAMEKGKRLEPKARALYELRTGREMPPLVVEYSEMPFLSASLDGYNEGENRILEIKTCGVDVWKKTSEDGYVPEHYTPQLQHQLLVTGANVCDYCAYNDEIDDIAIVEVFPDREFMKTLVTELKAFWRCVTTKTPPPLSDRDYKTVNDRALKELITEWSRIDYEEKALAEEKRRLRDAIVERAPHPRIKYRDVRICRVVQKGAVDYKKIPELKDVNVDQFRKKDVEKWVFKNSVSDKDA